MIVNRLKRFARSNANGVRSAAFARDPHSFYRELRAKGKVHYLEDENAWLVVGYEHASSILRQPQIFSSSPFAVISPALHGADPPDHTVMRRLVQPYFTPERQHAQFDSISRHTERALARLRTMRTFDAVADLAMPISFGVSCEWLGLDETLAAKLHERPIPEVRWEEIQPALKTHGLLPTLAGDAVLPESQLAELAVFFLGASYGSSRDLLLLSLAVLMDRKDIVEAVLSDPSQLEALVEELLRLEPSAHTLLRRTKSEVVLDGKTIPAGSTIWISLGAANRDPDVFDNPDELRLDRTMTRHLAFGVGPHFCIGSPMARLESRIMLGSLMPMLPDIESAGPMDVVFWKDFPGGAPSSRQVRSWPLRFAR